MLIAELVLSKYVAWFSHSLPKQMLTPDKIFMTISSTAFVHMCHNNQDKMNGLEQAYVIVFPKDRFSLFTQNTRPTFSDSSILRAIAKKNCHQKQQLSGNREKKTVKERRGTTDGGDKHTRTV